MARPKKGAVECTTTSPTPVELSDYVPKAQFEALQESYKAKCMEVDRINRAYMAMAIRFNKAGQAAKQFVKTATTGIELLFPNDIKEN